MGVGLGFGREVLGTRRAERRHAVLCELLGEGDVVQHAQLERLRAVTRLGEEAGRLVVLPVIEEEVGAPRGWG